MRKRMACRLMLDDELGADERAMISAGARARRRAVGVHRRGRKISHNPRCELHTTPSE